MENNKKLIVTHSSKFHSDDVFAVATLLSTFLPNTILIGSLVSKLSFPHANALVFGALLVRADEKWTCVKSAELRPSDLRACTIDDPGTHIACVRNGKVVVVQR